MKGLPPVLRPAENDKGKAFLLPLLQLRGI
jgi:hypothetical protein